MSLPRTRSRKWYKTRAETAQTMANSDSLRLSRQLQTVKSVTVNNSVSQLESQYLSPSIIQSVSQSVSHSVSQS